MNKIRIDNNKLSDYIDKDISILDNVIRFISDGDYYIEIINSNNINIDFLIDDNVDVKLFILSKNNKLISNVSYNLGKYSNLVVYQFYCNDSVVEDINVNLNGEYSKYKCGLSSVVRDKEEYNIVINHNNHNVNSYISNKCIGYDGGDIKFNIDSILDKGNIDCVMDQSTKILVLGDVNTSINPNMFIEEDSVEARHGSVVSGISVDDIFYLMSRGIDKVSAVDLLSRGFILSNLDVDSELENVIVDCIKNVG